MTHTEWLTELASLIGGRVDNEELIVGGTPRLYTQYRGHFVKADFLVGSELILDVNTSPPQRLRIRREGIISKALGTLGILCDHKVGDAAFDEKYLIDNATQEWAAAVLCEEVRELLGKLEPFAFFELTNKEFRCFKSVDIGDYAPGRAAADVDAMVGIADLVCRMEPQAR